MPEAVSARAPPVRRVHQALAGRWDADGRAALPTRWERLGHVLVLPRLDLPQAEEAAVAQAYAQALGCRSVLVRTGPVTGPTRRPGLRLVWGDADTTTVVRQHGVSYRFDPRRVMFSAGNLEERARMGRLDCAGQTVVDLFAGLGYLSLPIAVHGTPHRVVGCEIDAVTGAFLAGNVALNAVSGHYEARVGDNRRVAPRGVADRVVMGYLHGTEAWLDLAFDVLRPEGGMLHFHSKEGREHWPDGILGRVRRAADLAGRRVRLDRWRRVKTYAPHVIHGVLDVEVRPA